MGDWRDHYTWRDRLAVIVSTPFVIPIWLFLWVHSKVESVAEKLLS